MKMIQVIAAKHYLAMCSCVALSFVGGCSGKSTWIEPPEIKAEKSAAKAMEMYDGDSNGLLDAEELKKAPGLRAAMKTLDQDGDQQVSESEIADRIRSWQKYKAGLTSILCDVTLDGQPLDGATVTFEPESFLGDDIKTAIGTTTLYGRVSPSIPKENRPSPDTPSGLQLGLYRVRVSKKTSGGEERIPAKYNSETILGQQVAADDPAVINRGIRFKLNSR